MSIRQLGDSNTKAPEQKRPAPQANVQQNNRPDYNQGGNEPNMHEDVETLRDAISNRFGDRQNPTHALVALNNYAKSYVEAHKRDKNYIMTTFIVEREVGVPGVVIANVTNSEDDQKQPMTVIIGHVLMLADLSIKPEPLYEIRDGSRTLYETTVWADALDDDYRDAIVAAAYAQTDFENIVFIDAGKTVYNYADLPMDKLTAERPTQDRSIDNLLFTAMTVAEAKRALEAGDTSQEIRPGLVPAGFEIVADINLTPNTSQTAGGLPVAEDFRISVKQTKVNRGYNQQDQNQYRSLNRKGSASNDWSYGEVSGRIDFLYTVPRAEAQYISNPRPEDSAAFVPEFIATGFDVKDTAPSLTMLTQMIASVGMLGDRDPAIFTAAFLPENVAQTPSRNIGALAAKLKDPKTQKFEKRAEFRTNTPEDEFYKFINCAIIQDYRIGLEVPTQGPLVTLLEVFHKAALYAKGYPEYKVENDMLIDAFDTLTGGGFSPSWGNGPVMEPEIILTPGGYWTDDRGHKRDSREITNYLYLANLENPKEALDMSDDYLASFNIENDIIAANKRLELITQIKGANFVQTDNFFRCYFNAEAYALLLSAMLAAGTSVATPRVNFGGRPDDRRRIDSVGGRVSRDVLARSYRRFDNNRNGYSNNTRNNYYGNRR